MIRKTKTSVVIGPIEFTYLDLWTKRHGLEISIGPAYLAFGFGNLLPRVGWQR